MIRRVRSNVFHMTRMNPQFRKERNVEEYALKGNLLMVITDYGSQDMNIAAMLMTHTNCLESRETVTVMAAAILPMKMIAADI